MIEPEAEIAAAITDSGRVGVLATPATVEGGAYLRSLARQHRELTVTQVAAPDLAAIIQRGFPFSEAVVDTVRSYCAPLQPRRRRHGDPRLHPLPARRPLLQRILGRDVRLVTAGHAIAATVERILEARDLDDADARRGRLQLRLHRRAGALPRAGHALPAAAARRGRAGRSSRTARRDCVAADTGYPQPMAESTLEQIQADTKDAMKAGDATASAPCA